MKILLLGANGQVGWELQGSLVILGQVKACARNEVDLEDRITLRKVILDYCPDIIVNAAAYTAVDKAESEPDKAYSINAESVALLAEEARQIDAWLIHYSTDYVFDGTKKAPYVETDKPNPQSVYGKTKLQGEQAIENSGCKHLIFRTSWVYAERGENFAITMMNFAKEQDELRVVSDQIGAPTSAQLIADITSLCLHQIIHKQVSTENVSGIYHLTPTGETSRYGFIKFVITEAQRIGYSFKTSPENIHPISTSAFPAPAERPVNSLLATQKLSKKFKLEMPDWQYHVHRLVKELHANIKSSNSPFSSNKIRRKVPSINLTKPKLSIIGSSGWWGRGMVNALKSTEIQLNLFNSTNSYENLNSSNTDLVYECTGNPQLGKAVADFCLSKELNLMTINAEFDCHFGPEYTLLFEDKGLSIEGCSGDQPGSVAKLHHEVRKLGFTPIINGMCKGFLDKHQNPDGIKKFLRKGHNPFKTTSFADGTKVNIEAATICNYLNAYPDKRGMHGPDCAKEDLTTIFPEITGKKNIVDFTLGIEGVNKGGGIFIIAELDNKNQAFMDDLEYMKLGEGPYYLFFRDYHLCYFEAVTSILDYFDDKQSVLRNRSKNADVMTVAKKRLKRGEIIDELGGYAVYGEIEEAKIISDNQFLPISISQNKVLKFDVAIDTPITTDMIE